MSLSKNLTPSFGLFRQLASKRLKLGGFSTASHVIRTGLYYYGARYYDPAIGRFISADIIVQSLANPQTLNRYSYCLNNPLKYIDPTGHIVEIENEDIALELAALFELGIEIPAGSELYTLFEEWAALKHAWYLLGIVAPKLTSFLEERPETVTIRFYDFEGELWGQSSVSGGTISVDITLKEKSIATLASVVAHEAMHSAYALTLPLPLVTSSYAEEAFCYSIQYYVYETLTGKEPKGKNSVACKDFHPGLTVSEMEEQITSEGGIRDTLQEGDIYNGPYLLWGNAVWPTGFIYNPAKTLIETAKTCWPAGWYDD